MKITMLGAGAWGTAVAHTLAGNGHKVTLWCRENHVAQEIQTRYENCSFLPGCRLDEHLQATDNLVTAVHNADIIFVAIPVQHARAVLKQLHNKISGSVTWVLLNKGIEAQTLLLPSQIIETIFGNQAQTVAVMGPSFARDLVKQQPTGLVVASSNQQLVAQVQKILKNNFLVLESADDILGVQLCAAVKNVIALGMGILSGACYGDNTKTLFLVKVLQEVEKLVTACGGQSKTVYSLAGIGDTVLTSCGVLSRNLEVGKLLGAGTSLKEIMQDRVTVPEGVATAQAVGQLIQKKQLQLELLQGVRGIVYGNKKLQDFITQVCSF